MTARTVVRLPVARPIRVWTSKTNAKMVEKLMERPSEEPFYEDEARDDDEAH